MQFYRSKGFAFPKLLSYQGLHYFVQMKGAIYIDLVKAFYANAHVEYGLLVSKVKGIHIILDNDVWSSIARFRLRGATPHRGMLGVSKLEVYYVRFYRGGFTGENTNEI